MTTKPLQSLAGHIHLHEPLPWDVLDSRGQPLLRKGVIVEDARQLTALLARGVFVDQDEFERHLREKPQQSAVEESVDPFYRWEQLLQRLILTLREHVTDPNFVSNITQIASDICELTDKDADASIFSIVRLDMTSYPVAHSLQTALVSNLIAMGLGFSVEERKLLLQAALTMNIAMIELQKKLHKQSTPLTDQQRAEIRTHPIRGWKNLEVFGVKHPDWLRAVAEHHEATDGKGYPAGHTEVLQLAQITRQADMYCAMITGRAYRKALPPNRVARELFVAAANSDPAIPSLIIKQLGLYPPGSFVKLANGEIGIVGRRGASAKAPQVFGLQDRKGVSYTTPTHRDTSVAEFAVAEMVADEEVMFQSSPSKLFGYVTN